MSTASMNDAQGNSPRYASSPTVSMTVITLVLGMLLPAVVSILMLMASTQSRISEEENMMRAGLVEGMGLQVDEVVDALAQSLEVIAANGGADADDATRWTRLLQASRAFGKQFLEFHVANPNGDVISSSASLPEGINVADRGYFSTSLATEGMVASEGLVSRHTGQIALYFALAVRSDEEAHSGVVFAGFNGEVFGDMLRKAGPRSDGLTVFVLDRNGDSVYEHLPSGGRHPVHIPPADLRDCADGRRAWLEFGGTRHAVSVMAKRLATGEAPYLYLLVSTPDESFFSLSTLRGVTPLLLGTLCVALAALAAANRRIVHPLESLTRKVQAIEAGQPLPETAIESVREIGGLQTAVTRMAQAISQREQELAWFATHDDLTGLANRKALHEMLAARLDRLEEGASETVAVIFIDIDRFKAINDSMGHTWGDNVIAAFAARLGAFMHPLHAFCARVGGDEFVVVPDASATHNVVRDTRALLAHLGTPYDINGREVRLSASAGVLFVGDPGESPDVIIRNANAAMHRSKERGFGRISIFRPLHLDSYMLRLDIERELPLAAATGQLHMVYQPIVNASDGSLHSFEALMRWNHPRHGSLSPATFITVAEQTGHVGLLGDFALREAGACVRRFGEAGLLTPGLRFGVNISPAHLMAQDFLSDIESVLDAVSVPGDRITLEVTESALISTGAELMGRLETLAKRGLNFAIDDYGAGYSNIQYLASEHFRVIKIDKSLIDEVHLRDRMRAIVRSTVQLAHSLGCKIVAEGVETHAQANLLARLGCDYLQGYLFSRPVPETDAMRLAIRAMEQGTLLPPEAHPDA